VGDDAGDCREIAVALTTKCPGQLMQSARLPSIDFLSVWSKLASSPIMSEQQEQPVLDAETVAQPMSRTMYFPVSPLKLVVMATCTFGLYEVYWFYRHWGFVRVREKSDIRPFARAFFAPLFCYSLFKRIETTGVSCNISRSIAPGPLAAGWFVFTILARLPDPF
jgi:hypothetical protein